MTASTWQVSAGAGVVGQYNSLLRETDRLRAELQETKNRAKTEYDRCKPGRDDDLRWISSPGGIAWLSHAGGVAAFPFVVLVFAFGRGSLSRVLGSGPLRILGEMSYSIYLTHLTIFTAYFIYVDKGAMVPDYVSLVACIILTLGLSAAVWRYIENPPRRAIKRWLALDPRPGRDDREAPVGPHPHVGGPTTRR